MISSNPSEFHQIYIPPSDEKKETVKEDDSSKTDVQPEIKLVNPSPSNDIPYTEGSQLFESYMSQKLQKLEKTQVTILEKPSPSVDKQIEIVNSVMKHGLITKARAQNLSLTIIQSADRDTYISDNLCLNYIHSTNGRQVSLTHPAKGGLPVVLEREKDPLVEVEVKDPRLLEELSNRAHCSMLFVISVNKNKKEDPVLTLTNKDGKEFQDDSTYISTNQFGCMETRTNGSVAPENITYVILPKSMEQYKELLDVPTEKLIFVPSCDIALPFNIGNKTKGMVTISCPDYLGTLNEITDPEIFTHMLRSQTDQELGKK